MHKTNATKTVYALLPTLCTEVGHLLHYHKAAQSALQNKGWRYVACIPHGASSPAFPQDWLPCLAQDQWEYKKRIWTKVKILFQGVLPLRRLFRTIHGKQSVIFLESFELQHLISIILALWLIKPSFHVWILHRYALGASHRKTRSYRLFHRYIEKKVGKSSVFYLTDSDLLANLHQQYFHRPITVIPIPHAHVGSKSFLKIKQEKERLFWWPGGSIREGKGLNTVRSFIQCLKKLQAHLVVAEAARPWVASDRVIYIPTVLSREDYCAWMERTSFVLLPYLVEEYAHGTSGIFVEAICGGAIPLVTRATWMDYELRKFDILDLSFDWKEKNLEEKIEQISNSQDLLKKLDRMQHHYRTYHSEKQFADILVHLQKTSTNQ